VQDKRTICFIKKVKRFREIDKNYRHLIEKPYNQQPEERLSELIQLMNEAHKQKNLIELDLSENDYTTLQTDDDEVKETIIELREGEEFDSTSGLKILYQTLNKGHDTESQDFITDNLDFGLLNSDELFEHFHSWFDINDYYISKLRVGPIIASKSVPEELMPYFDEVREAYALNLGIACTSLCRTLLETCVVKELSKIDDYQERLRKLRKKGRRKDFSLFENIRFAFDYGLIDKKLKCEANDIRIIANDVLHALNKQPPPDKSLLDIIRGTVRIIEHFYG